MDTITSARSQLEFMPLEEDRLLRIKEEFQSTVTDIQSAMMLAINDYDKKCSDYDSLLIQLNAERNKTKLLERQLKQAKESLKQKDELILKLKLSKDISERNGEFDLGVVGQSKENVEKSNETEKKTSDFKIKLRNILEIIKPDHEGFLMAERVPGCIEPKTKSEEPMKCGIDISLKKDNNGSVQNNIHCEFDHQFKTEMHTKKLSRSYLTFELNRIIGENRAIIAGLKKVQQ